MEDIHKSISTLKELTRCTNLDKVRKLKRKFEDFNLEQDIEKCGMLSLDQLIEHTKDLVNEVEGQSTYGKFPKRIHLDVCKDTKGDILSTSKLFGETTTMRNMENIYDLINGDVRKIGVYGKSGIGKTTIMKHINNRILKEKNDKFDWVIWVTVSKESSIFNLQHDIARKIDVNLSNYKNPTTRAGALFKVLKQKGRYLLILDNLWEGYPLEDVGIPDPDDPTSSNICKILLTTRSLDVCRSMKCKDIKMDLLFKDEAWNLFLHHVGHDILQVKDLEPIARGVASACACLPLEIATMGLLMRGITDACEWKYALAKLRAFSKESGDMGHIPKGLKELSNYFISFLIFLPPQIIPRLSNLRNLVCNSFTKVSASELMGLKNLEIFHGSFHDIQDQVAFVKHREQEESPLINYKIEVLSDFCHCSFGWKYGGDLIRKVVLLAYCNLGIPSEENDLYLLPKDVQVLVMEKIDDLPSLCAIASLKYTRHLWFCLISSCKGVRELVTSSSSSFALQSLKTLRLYNLENLEALIGRRKAPCNVFPCLQELEICGCDRIKELFNVGLLSNLKNLEKLKVSGCWRLEEIIGESLDTEKDLNEAMTCVSLPKLRYLYLCNLPNLKSMCPPTRLLICQSLQEIHIEDCPELEQCVYVALEDSGEPSQPPSLQPIELKLYNNRKRQSHRGKDDGATAKRLKFLFNV